MPASVVSNAGIINIVSVWVFVCACMCVHVYVWMDKQRCYCEYSTMRPLLNMSLVLQNTYQSTF